MRYRTNGKRSGTCYTNLVAHMQFAHSSAYKTLSSGQEITQPQMESYFSTTQAGKKLLFDTVHCKWLTAVLIYRKIVRL